jgi:hypothetical protein
MSIKNLRELYIKTYSYKDIQVYFFIDQEN